MNNIMIDLETMGTGPRAAIVAVGAVRFGAAGLGEWFYRRVDLSSAMASGLEVDAETIRWWMRQGDAARDEVASMPGDDISTVLYELGRWMVREGAEPWIWGNGAVSDPVWLASAYGACGFAVPWKHWQARCFRTLKAAMPWVSAPEARVMLNGDVVAEVRHHALQDAVRQARHAVMLLGELERVRPPAVEWGAVESHEAPCPGCGDTGTAADEEGLPVPCGCWMGQAGVAAAEAIRAVPIFPGGPSIPAAPLAAGLLNNLPAATETNASAETAGGLNGESVALCAGAPGESVLTTGVSSLPREFWRSDSPAHGG